MKFNQKIAFKRLNCFYGAAMVFVLASGDKHHPAIEVNTKNRLLNELISDKQPKKVNI